MKKQFYSHLINIERFEKRIERFDLYENERHEIITIFHETIHHTVVNIILTELDEENKKTFFKRVQQDDHSYLWDDLSKKISKLEEKIKEAKNSIEEEIIKEIDNLK